VWSEEFSVASWNGVSFHMLKTNESHGQRIQVSELPYSDEPVVDTLGAKAGKFQFSAVFVGAESLKDAKTFQAELSANPIGVLEHPYLGELDLVYQDSSVEHISTKKGLVSVSISFVKQGATIVIPDSVTNNIQSYTQPVVVASTVQFIEQVESATPDEIETIKNEIGSVLDKVRSITDQLNISATEKNQIVQKIRATQSNVSSLSNSPDDFTSQLNDSMNSVNQGINIIETTEQSFTVLDQSHLSALKLKKLEDTNTTEHLKVLTTISAIETSGTLKELEKSDEWPSNLADAQAELSILETRLEQRKTAATSEATEQAYEKVSAIDALKTALAKHSNRLKQIENSLVETQQFSPVPALFLSHQSECDYDKFNSINIVDHPLFVAGKVRLPNG